MEYRGRGGGRKWAIVAMIFTLFFRSQGGAAAAANKPLTKKVICEFYDNNLNDDGETGSLNSFFQSEGGNAENASDTSDVDIAKKMMVCAIPSQYCYALWSTSGDINNGTNSSTVVDISDIIPKFLKQGCWEASPPSAPSTSDTGKASNSVDNSPKNSGFCQRPNCTAYYKKKDGLPVLPPNHMHFCCCQGNYCNADVFLEAIEDEEDSDDYYETLITSPSESSNSKNSLYLGLIIFIVVILTAILGVVVAKVALAKRHLWKHRNGGGGGGRVEGGLDDELGEDQQEEEHLINNDFMNLKRFNKGGDYDDTFDLKLDIDSILDIQIANGRWGRIYSTKKGQGMNQLFANKSLALKIYSPEHREFFDNEKFVYECLGKENDYILKYYGWTETPTSLVLAFDLVDCNLREFLKTETLNCQELVDILLGISRGVAYLHNGGVSESSTAVAHRDLTSRNVLIDLKSKHVYIADFGLSLLTRGSKYFWGGRERQAEFCSLAEAGTLRYMAPELLEGAVNLKDCENALKQADVYSMSLILWEVANSCGDLKVAIEGQQQQQQADTNEVPTTYHALPYDEEAGNKDILNLDDVVRLVVQNRIRPSFHTWSENGLTRAIRDTLNESWDSEPDARLTSLCIVERFQDLKNSLNNKFITKSTKALEKKRVVITEEWVNRNPCMQRNTTEFYNNASGSITDTNSVVTMATNLSSGGSTDGHNEHKFINNVALSQQQPTLPPLQPHFNQPKAIQLIQNIRK